MVGSVIKKYFDDSGMQNPFPSGFPSKKWWKNFFTRWPSLSERKPEHLTIQRAKAGSTEVVDKFYSNLENILQEEGLLTLPYSELGRRLWNCDETGLCTSVTSKKVIVRKGQKDVYEIGTGSGRDNITVLACGSAIGERVLPYVVYKAKTTNPSWMEGGPHGCMFSVSNSGWMESAQFSEWFIQMFLPATKLLRLTAPVVLLLNGHGSHVTLELVTEAAKQNTIIICLPPHTTHILQPLDVSVFKSVKHVWVQLLKEFKSEKFEAVVSKRSFPSLLSQLWKESFFPEHLVSGFHATGIHPLNRSIIREDKLKPSEAYSGTSIEQPLSATPVTERVTGIFKKHFQTIQETKANVKGSRLQPGYYGEALTSEAAIERLKQREMQKSKAKSKSKQQVKKTVAKSPHIDQSESTCQGCGAHYIYDKDTKQKQKNWIGCDKCWRWYHYHCANLSTYPDLEQLWMCPECSH